MELRHLRYFVAVAEELNFTRAAERLETAQPSLSQQVKQLEKFLGAALLVRNKRRVELTEVGHAFLSEARDILARTERAVQRIRETAGNQATELSVAVAPAAEVKVLPKLLPLVQRKMPGLRLILHTLPTSEQKVAFANHSVDVGFLRGPVSLVDAVVEPLLDEKLVIGLPSKHPLAAKKRVRIADLNSHPFIMIARKGSPELHDAVLAFCEQSGLRPPVAQRAGNVLGNLNLIRNGVGFGLLPDYVASILPRGVTLRHLDLKREPVVPLVMARSTRTQSPLLLGFLRLVESASPSKLRRIRSDTSLARIFHRDPLRVIHCARLIMRILWMGAGAIAVASAVLMVAQQPPGNWIAAGATGTFGAQTDYVTSNGRVGVFLADGPVEMKDHPFFTPLGTNGRACVTCHQPSYGMSFSAEAARDLWRRTNGKDPLFAAIDGSNCPDQPQDEEKSHSLLLNRGLIRVFLPVPKTADFSIDIVSDPPKCNTSSTYGLKSATPMISVYRRPRVVANLKYVTSGGGAIVLKLGALADKDPATGRPVGMNFMADAREATLTTQARSAMMGHIQAKTVTDEQLRRIVDFESQVYVAQMSDRSAGNLAEPGGPAALGPKAMADHKTGGLGDNDYDPVFHLFDAWKKPGTTPQELFRASVARGSDIFMFRQFWLRDATHINSIGLGNPLKRTCATCHNAQMTGQDLSAGWVDLGTTNYPRWTEPPLYSEAQELPVFKVTCKPSAQPHPYLGRVIYTTDPGRALISGRCVDVGSIVMQQFRGLSARAPYFSNGSAKNLRELVDYYDRRFEMRLTETDKQDLINFLGVL